MWIFHSLLSALAHSFQLSVGKRLVVKFSSWFVAWTMHVVMLVLFLIFGYFTYQGVPWENVSFSVAMAVAVVPYIFGSVVIIESTKRCDLSIVAPIVALTPIFIVVIEYFWLGAVPGPYGFLGIGMVVLGGYILNLSKAKGGKIFEPILSVFRRGQGLFALTGAFLFAFSATGCKVALQYSDAYSFATAVYVLSFFAISLVFGILLSFRVVKFPKFTLKDSGWLGLHGVLLSINGLANQLAFALAAYASYVISLKRMSALFGVVLGVLFFKEKGLSERMTGAVVMVAGVVVLAVFG
ncbi:EamA family transporter [Candidatus Peregrinibacteria bacterium]|nr:EamA family transporter [Candidatus Peregrinibacteria bacterium]